MTTGTVLPIDEVVALCWRAGEAILEVYRGDFMVDTKPDASPLTRADLAAHELLVAGLTALPGGLPVLSEEDAQRLPTQQRQSWRRYWLVDPLDGTREFIHRRGEFTVNVALVEDHVATFGVVHVPVSGETYWGCATHGAHRLDAEGISVQIQARRHAARPLRVLGSRSHPDPHLSGYLAALGEHALHTVGSSLKFCRIAEGAADLYPRFGPTCEWDTAAGQAVAEAAGAVVVDLAGRPLRYNTRETLLNGHFLVYGDRERDWLAALPAALRQATMPACN